MQILVVLLALGSSALSCHITSNTRASLTDRDVTVTCASATFQVSLHDSPSTSVVRVSSAEGVEHLRVHITRPPPAMYITVRGARFDARDPDTRPTELAALQGLLDDVTFRGFPEAVRLIHDDLALRGWEHPSVMCLYRLGAALTPGDDVITHPRSFQLIDPDYYSYHGPSPTEPCSQNGESEPDVTALFTAGCVGTCGPKCMMCWKWVCGDCCRHTGCRRHDEFCRGEKGKFATDCLTFRGVLWDTVTDTPYDC